jgi:hypothetical protein
MATLEATIATLSAQLQRSIAPTESAQIAPALHDAEETGVAQAARSSVVYAITIRNRRYAHVLSVETYRLRDQSEGLRPDQIGSLTAVANQIRPRLDGSHFSGSPPLAVLSFLHQLIRVANQSHMSEAMLLWVVEDFIQSPAKESFRSQHFNTWPMAVHWLLTTYAPETTLESAVRRIQTTGQAHTESVSEFGLRLQLEASALGSLLSAAEVKSLYSQGLRDPVRSNFLASQPPSELDDGTSLSVLISRAMLLETGSRPLTISPARGAFPSTRGPARPMLSRSPVLLSPRTLNEEPSFAEDDVAEVLAMDARQSQSAPSERWTCFVCYLTGHGWLECPLLAHVPSKDKEDILVRRRRYLDGVRSRPSSPRPNLRWPASPGTQHMDVGEADVPKNVQASPRK